MRYLDLCKKWMMECVLSESKPAEALAAELVCRDRCAVLSRGVVRLWATAACQCFSFFGAACGLWNERL